MFKYASAILLGTLGTTTAALAQADHCAPRAVLIEQLKVKYGEIPAAGGLRSRSQMMEIWAAPETGSWTALVTTAEGISCIVATGTHWHQEKLKAAVVDIPS